MPVPARDFDHDALVRNRTMEERDPSCIEQDKDSHRQVYGVRSGQQIKEWTCARGPDAKAVAAEYFPSEQLPGDKRATEDHGNSDPRYADPPLLGIAND